MDVRVDRLDRKTWERFCDRAHAPLQQRWAYGETLQRMGRTVVRCAIYQDQTPIALAQVLTRHMVCRIALTTRGPVWVGEVSQVQRNKALRGLRTTLHTAGHAFLILTPDDDVPPPFGHAIMTPATTARVALTPDMRGALHGKWRNRLVKAEGRDLKIARVKQRGSDHDWLFHQEHRQRLERGYRNLPPVFAQTWLGTPHAHHLTLVAKDRAPIAGMMFLCHGTTATYHLGWTSAEGRATSAHTLTLWQAMEQLRADGVRFLDLGLLDTERAPGLARFKLGTGAAAHRLGATTLSRCSSSF